MSGYESPQPEDEVAPTGDQEAEVAGGLGIIPPNPGAAIPPIAAADVGSQLGTDDAEPDDGTVDDETEEQNR